MDLIDGTIYFIIFLLSLFYGLFIYKFNYWSRRGIPYIQPKIPYGNIQDIGKKQHSSQLMKGFYDEKKNASPFIGIYFFTKPFALICNLDMINNVLIKDFSYFTDRGLYYNEKDDPLSVHLFSLDGDKWKALRSKLTPTFTSGKMKFMFPTVVDVATEFQKTLSELCANGEIDIEVKDILARFTTDVIGTCAFGIECNSLKNPDSEFRRMGKMVFEQPKNSGIKQMFMLTFRKIAIRLGMTMTRKEVSSFFLNVVKETMELREKHNIKRNDFMDLLMQLAKSGKLENDLTNKQEHYGHLTFEEIAAQVFLFFLAGFETSATTMSYCLYELAINQDIQTKARNEIENILEKYDGKFTYEALMDMTYIEQIVNESLRKYPPGASLIRKAVKDYPIPGTSNIIEVGTNIWIPVYAIHHDPEIYPEPEKFDPNRFLPSEMRKLPHCSFLPFGDGPRNCIGLRFGMMEARIGLVMLLKSFKFQLSEKTQQPLVFKKRSLVLTPEGGLWLKVENYEKK